VKQPPSVLDSLKFASLQLAAEAFLLDDNLKPIGNKTALIGALVDGNLHASRFSRADAERFASEWEVLNQTDSTPTGFSATLFKRLGSEEFVISFRSTEFIDDAVRDTLATNAMEITDTGWAWGQISDMEKWFAQLRAPGGALHGKEFSVTGYSLGGHLATAFNLLHPGEATQVVTFNGAGVGLIKGTNDPGPALRALLTEFDSLRSNPDRVAATFVDPDRRAVFTEILAGLRSGQFTTAAARQRWESVREHRSEEYELVAKALHEIASIESEIVRVGGLVAGGDAGAQRPKLVTKAEIAAADLAYRVAVARIGKSTESGNIVGDLRRTVSRAGAGTPHLPNQFEYIGDSWPSAVANSQWHHGTIAPVFIEDQPLFRGTHPREAFEASIRESGIRLLVDRYALRDFGDTHSLVLMVDSLAVQKTLSGLVPAVSAKSLEETLPEMLRASSHLRARLADLPSDVDQGRSEGDTLENVTNALSKMILGRDPGLRGSPLGNTWWRVDEGVDGQGNPHSGRDRLAQALRDLEESVEYASVAGKVKLVSGTREDLSASAKDEFGDFLALHYLAPFSVRAAGSDGKPAIDALWAKNHGREFEAWQADRDARKRKDATFDLTFTDEWYEDRGEMLRMETRRNFDNTEKAELTTRGQDIEFRDLALGKLVVAIHQGKTQQTRQVTFGSAHDDDLVAGTLAVRLYGLDGNDKLTGGAAADYLEGNTGRDVLSGGANADTLKGGADEDRLTGGAGTDHLYGGSGVDVLEGDADGDYLFGGDGKDDLRGGTGNDVLDGGKGDDTHRGGEGVDTMVDASGHDLYMLERADPLADSIKDGDGIGEVFFDADRLTGGDPIGAGKWIGKIGTDDVTYTWSPAADGRGPLIVVAKSKTTVIHGFKNGDLGILLGGKQVDLPNAPATSASVNGTAQDDNRATASAGRGPTLGSSVNDRVQALAGRDEAYGLGGNDIVEGGAGVDLLSGDDGHDAIFGEVSLAEAQLVDLILTSATAATGTAAPTKLSVATSEWLRGGLGEDTLVGTANNDILFGGGGKDLLVGGIGHDVINGDDDYEPADITTVTVEPAKGPGAPFDAYYSSVVVRNYAGDVGAADEIHGGSGNDNIYGQIGNDNIWGDDGNDTISGGEDDDSILGNNGDDRIAGDDYGLLVGDTAVTPVGDDFIDGGAGNDLIFGDGGSDTLFGGAGDDTLRGNNDIAHGSVSPTAEDDGEDYLVGGDGRDQLIGDSAADILLGEEGDDFLFGDGGSTPQHLQGDDRLEGGAGNDYLRGYGGNDTLIGGAGRDQLLGEGGDDVLEGGDLYPMVAAQPGDTVSGGEGNDSISLAYYQMGDAGDDILDTGYAMWGGDGDDVLRDGVDMYGGSGNDTLMAWHGGSAMQGEGGDDDLAGSDQSDWLAGGEGEDVIEAAGGSDFIWGNEGADLALGGAGHDQLQGGAGEDELHGAQGDDFILGQEDNDTLSGGAGLDYLLGGAGNDTYLVDGDAERDIIIDTEGTNVVEFGDGITPEDLAFSRGVDAYGNNGYIAIDIAPFGNSVIIAGGLQGAVAEYRFKDGATLTATEVASRAAASANPVKQVGFATAISRVSGSTGNDVIGVPLLDMDLMGGDGADVLTGGTGANTILGGTGNDRIDGGGGRDHVDGGLGADTYVFAADQGSLQITDQHFLPAKEIDVLELGAGIVPADVRLIRDNHDLVVTVRNSTVQARVKENFLGGMVGYNASTGRYEMLPADTAIEKITFRDGTVWDEAAIAERAATGSQNVMTGGPGDDVFLVDNGKDTVVESLNGGTDTIQSSVSYALRPFVEKLVLTGVANTNAWASPSNATSHLYGNDGNNVFNPDGVVYGADGQSYLVSKGETGAYAVMTGGKGDDEYYLDYRKGGSIVERPNEGIDTVYGTYGGNYTLPDNVENYKDLSSGLDRVGDGPDSLVGNALNNFLGYVGGNTSRAYRIDGGAGADVMQGAMNNDTYVVDNPGDRVVEPFPWLNHDTDTVVSAISYRLPGGVEELVMAAPLPADGWGNELDNRFEGSGDSVASRFYGGVGDDTYVLDGRDIAVELAGEGSDTVEFTKTGTRMYTAQERPANVENMALAESLGGSGLRGDWQDETLTGNTSANTLEGGRGDDTLVGGAGVDTYVFDAGFGNDVISEWADGSPANIARFGSTIRREDVYFEAGRLRVLDSSDSLALENTDLHFADGSIWRYHDWRLYRDASRSSAPTEDSDALNGTSASDTIDGRGGMDFIRGFEGDDTLFGGTGDDRLWGDDGDDLVSGGEGHDQAWGGAGADRLNGGTGSDTLRGEAGNDELDGGVDQDVLHGDDGNDTVTGGEGVDQLYGGTGDDHLIAGDTSTFTGDLLRGGHGRDLLEGGAGQDQLLGEEGSDVSRGGDGDDILYDLSGDNVLDGGAGMDTLEAGSGQDTLDGGAGDDRLNGGGGVDRYILKAGGGTDLVTDDWLSGDLTLIAVSAGLTPADIRLKHVLGDNGPYVSVSTADGTGELRLNTSGPGLPVEVHFADGAVWTRAEVLDRLYRVSGTGVGELLVGSEGDDRLYGLAGNDELRGLAGDDLLDGGIGADTLVGGHGQDVFIVDDAADSVVEEVGGGIDRVESSVSYTLSANVENLALVGTAAAGTGNSLDNIITGNAADNVLDGKAGRDRLVGGAGHDTFMVDNALDVLVEQANEGRDLVKSSISYALGEHLEDLALTGGAAISGTGNAADNRLVGNGASNMLTGGAGNDELDGAGGVDTLKGGIGNDVYIVDAAGDVVTESAGEGTDGVRSSVTYTLGANVENLTLTGTAAIGATGNGSNNILVGNSGSNVLNGGGGADVLSGGAGNDIYVVDNAGDIVDELAGGGTDLVQSALSWTLGLHLENLTLTGTGATAAVGNELSNTLTGNAGNNVLDGKAGNDVLKGGGGNDTYIVDSAGDITTELAGEGTDVVQSSVTLTLAANLEAATLTGTGAINVTGNALANALTGNAAANTLNGGAGSDTMKGGAGDDIYVIDAATDVVTELANEGTDTVQSAVTVALGANVENATLTGTAALNATGNTLANVLTGNSAANVLDGGAGADILVGGGGNDTYVIDNAGDLITEASGAGTDLANASISYVLAANVENLTLTGSASITGTGNALANLLTGNGGNNVLDGGAGGDTLKGGAGNDTYVVDVATDTVVENAAEGTDTVQTALAHVLSANVENLVLLGAANVNGTGNALNNTLTGNVGHNVLDGGAGNDILVGGAGDDTYVLDSAADVVTEAAGAGTDLVRTSLSHTLATNVEKLTLTGTSVVNGTGNALANVLTGNAADNILDGAAGADILAGGAGHDTYVVDHAGDAVTEAAGAGTDTINASIAYVLPANVEHLLLTGAAAVNGSGNALDNWVRGNAGGNTLLGADGLDALFGEAGSDILDGGNGHDLLQGGAGNDSLTDVAGNNVLDGGAGTDTLTGGAAREFFAGGAGSDTITTGGGIDVIVFNKGDGTDVINASVGTDDTLSLGGALAYADLRLKKTGADLILDAGGGDQITLKNWYQAGVNHKSILNLQVVTDAMAAFNPAGTDPTLNRKVVRFNFTTLVSQFDAALAANPALAAWSVANGLASAYAAGSDTAAIGGDFAYDFGHRNGLSGIGAVPAQSVLAAASFGSGTQALQAPGTLYAGVVRMS